MGEWASGSPSQLSNLKNFVRALELTKVDGDRAAQIVGDERGFTFRVYDPEGIDVAGLWEVVEAVRYEGLTLPKGGHDE